MLFTYTSRFCKFCFTQPFLSIFNVTCGNFFKCYTKYQKFTQALLARLSIIPCLVLPILWRTCSIKKTGFINFSGMMMGLGKRSRFPNYMTRMMEGNAGKSIVPLQETDQGYLEDHISPPTYTSMCNFCHLVEFGVLCKILF